MNSMFTRKLLENVIVSYLYAVIAYILLNSQGELNLETLEIALYAGIPAVLAALKGFLATFVNSPDSPALVE